eukprot:g77456.t1
MECPILLSHCVVLCFSVISYKLHSSNVISIDCGGGPHHGIRRMGPGSKRSLHRALTSAKPCFERAAEFLKCIADRGNALRNDSQDSVPSYERHYDLHHPQPNVGRTVKKNFSTLLHLRTHNIR